MKKIDLHTHTIYSDGELSPKKLCELAIDKGVNVLSITDHNTMEGYKQLLESNENFDIKVVPGVEFDAEINYGKMHILGYDIDVYDNDLENLGKRTLKINLERFRIILEVLKNQYAISFDDLEIQSIINNKFQVGKMDVALLLLNHGFVDSSLEAFVKYINPIIDDLKYKFRYPSYEEIIYYIRKSGGVSSLAHPRSLDRNFIEIDDLVRKLKGVGLNALEVYHSSHTSKQMKIYRDLAFKYNLLVSGGSDYHGDLTKPDVELGTGRDNLNLTNLSILKRIK